MTSISYDHHSSDSCVYFGFRKDVLCTVLSFRKFIYHFPVSVNGFFDIELLQSHHQDVGSVQWPLLG